MKKTLALLLAVLMLVSCFPVYGVTLETVEVITETAEAAEAAEAALTEVTNAPGINVLTGTAEPATMETMPEAIKGKSGIMTYDLYDDDGNNVIRTTCTSADENYPQLLIDIALESGRKYYYYEKLKFSGTNGEFGHWLMYDTGSSTALGLSSVSKNVWTEVSGDFTSTKTQNVLGIQQKVKGASADTPAYFYYDDLMLVPYYKITYIGLDGETTVTTVDYLFDSNGNVAKTYIPDLTLVEGATAYSATPGGAPVTLIKLENKDITLYARNDVADDAVYFTDGNKIYQTEATGDKFIMPYNTTTDFDLGEGEYINLWTDGTNYCYPGDVVDASAVKGVAFEAVLNDFAVWDETKGYLMYHLDFENGKTSGGYVNPRYTGTGFSTRSDGVASRTIVTDTDGNKVVSDTTNTNTHHLTGYALDGNRNFDETKGAKATAEFDFKYIDSAANYTSAFIRMCYNGAEVYYKDGYAGYSYSIASQVKGKTDGEWNTASLTMEDADNKGFQGGIVQFGKSATAGTVYIDNWKAWILPDTVAYFKSAEDATDWVRFPVDKTAETYTMPGIEETGFETENFIGWTDGTGVYKFGEAYALADVEHKMFYPFCQDTSAPAVISLFEGDTDLVVTKTKFTEPVADDGRTVLLVNGWAGSLWSGTKWMNDPRASLKYAGRYDTSEYTTISYMAKISSAFNAENTSDEKSSYKAVTTSSFAIYNYTNSAYSYSASSLIGTWNHPVDNNYHLTEIDMTTTKADVWKDTGWGFAFDINRVSYGGRTYLDYVRVYRKGITTVTYDTNAPEGATVVTEVAPDTGRGLGTGYLLKGERPVVEGHKFLGWALTPDATVADVVESIDLTGLEATVYAVWAVDNGAIETTGEPAMRFGDESSSGIRFKALATGEQRTDAEEYGFIVARKSHLDTYETELTHNFRNRSKNQNLFVEGQAYGYSEEYGKDIDVKYDADDTTGEVTYAVVCTNIPVSETGVNEVMVARPYYKYSLNGNTVYVYGEADEASLGEIAAGIDTTGEDYTNNKDYIDKIVSLITHAE